jgi:hypothetical protein
MHVAVAQGGVAGAAAHGQQHLDLLARQYIRRVAEHFVQCRVGDDDGAGGIGQQQPGGQCGDDGSEPLLRELFMRNIVDKGDGERFIPLAGAEAEFHRDEPAGGVAAEQGSSFLHAG